MSNRIYQISIERSAAKSLEKILRLDRNKIIHVIQELSHHPKPIGHKKLIGREGFRVRVGSY